MFSASERFAMPNTENFTSTHCAWVLAWMPNGTIWPLAVNISGGWISIDAEPLIGWSVTSLDSYGQRTLPLTVPPENPVTV